MNNNDVTEYCRKFLSQDAFSDVKSLAVLFFLASPDRSTLIATLDAYAATVLEAYIHHLAEDMATEYNAKVQKGDFSVN